MPEFRGVAGPTRDRPFETWVVEDVQIRKAVRLEDDMDMRKATNLLATHTATPNLALPIPNHMTGPDIAGIAQHRDIGREHAARRPPLDISLLNEHEKEHLALLEQQRLEESFNRKAKEREMKRRGMVEEEKQRLEWERKQEQQQERHQKLEREMEIQRVVQETIQKLEEKKQKEKLANERAARWAEMERERIVREQAARETELKMEREKELEAKRVQELEDAAFAKAVEVSIQEALKEKEQRKAVEAATERMRKEAEAEGLHNRLHQRVTGTKHWESMKRDRDGKMGGSVWNATPQTTRVPEIRAFKDDNRTGTVYPHPAATYPTTPADSKDRPLTGPAWYNYATQALSGLSSTGHGIERDLHKWARWDATAELDRLGEREAEIWRDRSADSHTWQETITERRETITRRIQGKDGLWR